MAFCLQRFKFVNFSKLNDLEKRLLYFYNNIPEAYYPMANASADKYNYLDQPFHCHLTELAEPSQNVLEVGCGTAHLCPPIIRRGAFYHGMDVSPELIEANRKKMPQAKFYTLNDPPKKTFDIVASLYTIEHTHDPIKYLQTLWDFCRPGGIVAIICPDFIDGQGFPRSIYYGRTPRRFREKLASFSLFDACAHLWELFIVFPLWKIYARSMAPNAFWINLEPSDLVGREHGIDGDAVHFPRLLDLVHWFKNKGASIITTSNEMKKIPKKISKHNCYIAARKPSVEK